MIIKFNHCKYWGETVALRKVHSIALKESQGRWYLLAIDTKDGLLKTFGLDRISNIEILNSRFKDKYNYNLIEMFNESFGIINLSNSKTEEIVLEFNAEQGNYINSYPLYHSQKIISDANNKIQFQLKLKISHDFVMKILRYTEDVKILKPKSLITLVTNLYKKAIQHYQ